MTFYVGTKAEVRALMRAMDVASGLPLRGRIVRDGVDTGLFVPGIWDANGVEQPGPGWTTQSCCEPDEVGLNSAVEVPAELEKYLGTTVKVDGKDVKLPAKSALLADEGELPAEFKELRAARASAQDAATLR